MTERPPLPWSGGCQCGAIRYEVTAPPLTLYCCHCRECQRQASSAFGMSMLVAPDALSIDWSGLASRARDEGLATEVVGRFCGACGVRIVHGRPERDVVSLKAGTLDDTSWLRPVGHVWTDSAQKPFGKGFPSGARRDSRCRCGQRRHGAGWPRSSGRRSVTRPI